MTRGGSERQCLALRFVGTRVRSQDWGTKVWGTEVRSQKVKEESQKPGLCKEHQPRSPNKEARHSCLWLESLLWSILGLYRPMWVGPSFLLPQGMTQPGSYLQLAPWAEPSSAGFRLIIPLTSCNGSMGFCATLLTPRLHPFLPSLPHSLLFLPTFLPLSFFYLFFSSLPFSQPFCLSLMPALHFPHSWAAHSAELAFSFLRQSPWLFHFSLCSVPSPHSALSLLSLILIHPFHSSSIYLVSSVSA